MSLGLPEILTPGPRVAPPSQLAYFHGLRVVLLGGVLEQPMKFSFVFYAKLADATLRSPLIRARTDQSFTVNYMMTFPYNGEPGLLLYARLDGMASASKLAAGQVNLRGATLDRPQVHAQLNLTGVDGAPWGSISLLVELTESDLDLRACPFGEGTERLPSLRPTPSAHYIPTPSDRRPLLQAQTSELRSTYLEPMSSKRSVTSNAPSQYDKIAVPTPFRGVKLIVMHGAGWTQHRGSDIFFVVACGARGIFAKRPVHVDQDGNFVMNEIFQHTFANDRLLHLAVFRSKHDMIAQAICDTLYLMECGVVTCKQHLSFYSRFGALEGHVEIVTEFLTEAPPLGVYSLDPSSLSPRRSPPVSRFRLDEEDGRKTPLQLPTIDAESTSTHSATPEPTRQHSLGQSPVSAILSPQGSAAISAYKAELLPFHTPNRSLLCAVWQIRDLPPNAKSCCMSMVVGQLVAAGQGLLNVDNSSETKIKKVFSLPYANQRFAELRVIVDCGVTMRGAAWIDVEGFALRGQTGMVELEVRSSQDNEYMGLVSVWLELNRREYPLETCSFPRGEAIMPPSSILALRCAEAFPELEWPQISPRACRLPLMNMCALQRSSSPSATSCGTPRGVARQRSSPQQDKVIQSKLFRTRCAQSLPPIDSTSLDQQLLHKLQAKSVTFNVYGLRNLPDLYGCQTMKLMFLVKSASEVVVCSQPIRITSLNPDFPSPLSLSTAPSVERLQIDLIEVSVPIKPILVGRINWSLDRSLRRGEIHAHKALDKGFLTVVQHHDSLPFRSPRNKDIFCLYAASLSKELPANAFCIQETEAEVAAENGDDEVVVLRQDRLPYTPNGATPTGVSSVSLCVTVEDAKGLVSPLPFEKQTLILTMEVDGKQLQSQKVLVERLQRVHFDTRFILPLPANARLHLKFRVLSKTPVTPLTQVAEGGLYLDGDLSDADWVVPLESGGSSPPASLCIRTEMVGRSIRVPLVAQVSSPTGASRGGRFFI